MSDPSTAPAESRSQTRDDVAKEIGRSLSSIWQRRDGARPVTIETEYVGDVVRCVVEQGEAPPPEDGEEPVESSTDSKGYGREAQATVARLTKRSVSAYIAKRNAKTGQATNTFILERIRTKH